ncbi:MAG: universal stress protein [Planctomycetota bacterium]
MRPPSVAGASRNGPWSVSHLACPKSYCRRTSDVAVDAIVMSKIGRRGKVEELLFGSTAEKVLRGSNKPVLILPTSD